MQLKSILPILVCLVFVLPYSDSQAMSIAPTQGASTAVTEASKTKSFREWKSERVQSALGKVTETRTKIQLIKSRDPNLHQRRSTTEGDLAVSVEALEDQLQQDQATLEMAKDLSVTDYFVGYLTKLQDKKSAFNEIAGKLTADEVAELMAAYANSVFGGQTQELSPSASSMGLERFR